MAPVRVATSIISSGSSFMMVFNNCTDFSTFSQREEIYLYEPFLPKKDNSRYVGFIGGLNRSRVDVDLLKILFKEFPDEIFLFVGYTNYHELEELINNTKNSFFIPFVEHKYLPYIIKSFDAAIIPHLINDHTKGNDLLKVIDYMACGVPVVTTNCSGVSRFNDCVIVANNNHEFINYLRKVLEGEIVANTELGLEYARSNSWSEAVPKLESWLKNQIN